VGWRRLSSIEQSFRLPCGPTQEGVCASKGI
jgi:hypothetical protein